MDPASKTPARVAFGRFRVLPHRREVLADGSPVKLGGRAFDVLITLLEGPGRVVSRDELIRRVWPNRVVEEKAARRAVAPAIGYMVEAVLALFLVTAVRGRRE
jgi:DNA-binding winged helix-turn-helix (wHTH) protein